MLAIPPTPNIQTLPKWSCNTINAVGPLIGDPSDSCHTCAQTLGTSFLSHTILDDPHNFL